MLTVLGKCVSVCVCKREMGRKGEGGGRERENGNDLKSLGGGGVELSSLPVNLAQYKIKYYILNYITDYNNKIYMYKMK